MLNSGIYLLLTFVVYIGIIIRLTNWFIFWHVAHPKHITPKKGYKVAFLTCFVPGSEPISMLRKTLVAMKNVRYDHDTWVLDEGNSDEVKQLCKELDVKHFSRKGIAKYNQDHGSFTKKTKGGNLNSWRDTHEKAYDFVAQVDMDHVPTKKYFERTLGYFEDPAVGFVGVPQVYKNVRNWIARGAAEQSFVFYGPIQQGLYGCDVPVFIGTTHVYRVKAMQHIGGYASNIAEDHLTGLHFISNGWKGVHLQEIIARGDGPTNWVDYFNQQMRWSFGLFEILFRHTPKHLPKMPIKHGIHYFFLQIYYFTGVSFILGLGLIWLYLLFGLVPSNINFNEWIIYWLPQFIVGQLVLIFIHRIQIKPKNQPIWGLRGMILGQAANIIYSVAFFRFILRKKLVYAVTQKGSTADDNDTLETFKLHAGVLSVTSIALTASYLLNNEAWVLQFWGYVTTIMMAVVMSSVYWRQTSLKFKKAKKAIRKALPKRAFMPAISQ